MVLDCSSIFIYIGDEMKYANKILNYALDYYRECLSDRRQMAVEELAVYGVEEDSIDEWNIGYASEDGGLIPYMIEKMQPYFTPILDVVESNYYVKVMLLNDLCTLGLIEKFNIIGAVTEHSEYSLPITTFKNCYMVPISNADGEIVGFSGLYVEKNHRSDIPVIKYSRGHLDFSWSENLFGLNKLYETIENGEEIKVVDSWLDVIKCWQNGERNIVGLLGTELTERQMKHLRRCRNNILLAFSDVFEKGNQVSNRLLENDLCQKTVFFEEAIETITSSPGITLIAGGPENGKTALLLQLAYRIAEEDGISTFLYSLEMSEEQIRKRYNVMRLDSDGLVIDDSDLDFEILEKRLSSANELKVVFVDYIELVFDDDAYDRFVELANKYDVHFVVISQLDRGVYRYADRKPRLKNIERLPLVNEANVIMTVWRNNANINKGFCTEEDIIYESEINVVKNNLNESFRGRYALTWNPERLVFEDSYREELIARAMEVFSKFKETHPPKEITEDDLKDWDSYE